MTTPTTLADVSTTVTSGSLVLAVPLAVVAGLVSFLSPCVLPLVPGYLSYVTGLSGADLASPSSPARARGLLVAGTGLFVAGFTFVFVSIGFVFGALGDFFVEQARPLQIVLGGATVVMGLAFLGLVPALGRERRIHRTPRLGLAGAPLLGVLFGVGWAPCIGPTLGAVLSLSYNEGDATRGAFLAVCYCLGLGLPFLAAGLAYRRALGAFAWVRGHYALVMRAGGAMLVTIGLLLVTGVWQDLVVQMQVLVRGYTPVV